MKGAFETEFNNRYILPTNAYKKPNEDAYKCCDKKCNGNLILCKGNKKEHYFRHFSGSNCERYKNQCLEQKQNDNEKHEEAKLQLKSWLEQGKNIKINKVCARCKKESFECCTEPLTINSSFILEQRSFNGDNPIIYDIAHLQKNNIIEAFEIYSSHLTNENNRPNNIKWYDIKADEINDISYSIKEDKEQIILTNIRFFKCKNCIKIEKKKIKDDIKEEFDLNCKRQKQQEENERIELIKLEKQRIILEKQEENERIILKQQEENKRIRLEKQRIRLEKQRIILKQEEENERIRLKKQEENYIIKLQELNDKINNRPKIDFDELKQIKQSKFATSDQYSKYRNYLTCIKITIIKN